MTNVCLLKLGTLHNSVTYITQHPKDILKFCLLEIGDPKV